MHALLYKYDYDSRVGKIEEESQHSKRNRVVTLVFTLGTVYSKLENICFFAAFLVNIIMLIGYDAVK